MDISSYVTVLPIVIICYLVGIGCKASKKISDKTIPVIVGIVGGIVAVPAMYVMKSFPAEDIITAISVGIMSGFASTGINQVYKQSKKEEKKQAKKPILTEYAPIMHEREKTKIYVLLCKK